MKIGIYGGTFDPVHLGHEALAKDACEQAGLHEVIMVPAGVQPFKKNRRIVSGEDRFRMLALFAEQDDRITVSRYELQNESVSYTYLTMRAMQEMKPGADLYFICGADSFLKLDMWMNAEELLTKYSYIIGARPGYMEEGVSTCMQRLEREYGTRSIRISNEQMDISSTEIRARLAADKDVSDLISQPVERYIREHELYL